MATAEKTDYEVGQQLWTTRYGANLSPIYVTQVGRKWVYYAYAPSRKSREYRFYRNTRCTETSDKVYASQDEWRAECRHSDLISRIHMLCSSRGVLAMLSTEQLEAILEIVSQAEQKQD